MLVFDKRLRPCPICGSTDIYLTEKTFIGAIQMDVGCASCGLKGFKNFSTLVDDKEREEKTIEYWNTRATDNNENSNKLIN